VLIIGTIVVISFLELGLGRTAVYNSGPVAAL